MDRSLHRFMMFSEKLDCKLIRLVKDNPVLYDPNDMKYMDFNSREVAWHKIGDELKRPAADCKQRWIHIRDVHRRILRKLMRNPDAKMKMYKYDHELEFMRPFYKELVIPVCDSEFFDNNDDDDDDDEEQPREDPIAEDVVESDESEKPVIKRKRGRGRLYKSKKRKVKDEEVETVEIVPEKNVSIEDSVTQLDPKDPVDAFLLSIGATLKTFSAYHLNLAKSEIFTVVQQHEMQQIVQQPQRQHCETKVSTSNHDHIYSS